MVVLPGGADAVRSVSSDGLIWTIRGDAAGAKDVRVGAVMLATSFAAGRVLAVDEVDGDKRVALGPVALTDVIKDGTISSEKPISVENFHAYGTPDQPGLQTDEPQDPSDSTGSSAGGGEPTTSAAAGSTTTGTGASFGGDGVPPGDAIAPTTPRAELVAIATPSAPTPPRLPPMAPPSPKAPSGTVGGWRTTSICCTENGIHAEWNGSGAKVQGTAAVKFTKPSVTFHLHIGGGSLIDADVKLNGAASLSFGIAASVENSSASFRSGRIQLPVNLVIPIPVAGIPMNISFQQIFSVNLGLSGKALLATDGEYSLGGSLGFSVHNGTPSAEFPKLTTKRSALDRIQSLAVAPQGLTFAYTLKTSIGVGPPGLSAGIWYQVSAALSLATSGAQLDPIQGTSLVTCKTVSLRLFGRYGVGYTIPNLVARAINFFLGTIFRSPARVAPSGGPSWGPTQLYSKDTPPCSSSRGRG